MPEYNEYEAFVSPAGAIQRAIEVAISRATQVYSGDMQMYPEPYLGQRNVILFNPDPGHTLYVRYLTLSLSATDVVPGAYAVRPGDWDTYVSVETKNFELEHDPGFWEVVWGILVESKMNVLQEWISGTFEAGTILFNSYCANSTWYFDCPITLLTPTGNITIQNRLYVAYRQGLAGTPITPTRALLPMISGQGSVPVGGGVELGALVQALNDIAQRTTVMQINNRGAIADLASGDVVAPGGTDVPE